MPFSKAEYRTRRKLGMRGQTGPDFNAGGGILSGVGDGGDHNPKGSSLRSQTRAQSAAVRRASGRGQ